jgi:hypothetical protein
MFNWAQMACLLSAILENETKRPQQTIVLSDFLYKDFNTELGVS